MKAKIFNCLEGGGEGLTATAVAAVRLVREGTPRSAMQMTTGRPLGFSPAFGLS
jgi:hypothetical protein